MSQLVVLGLWGAVLLTNTACLILTLIRLFSKRGIGLGLLGLICFIYTFYWGWKNIDRPTDRTVMTVWTIALVSQFILNFAMRTMA